MTKGWREPQKNQKGKSIRHSEVAHKKDLSTTLRHPLVAVDSSIQVKTVEKKEKSMRQRMLCGEITSLQYSDFCAKLAGFKNNNDRRQHWRHLTGRHKPQSENKKCGNYLGIVIAERILSKIFENVTRMSNCNKGYDFICGKGYKIDVKSGCPDNENEWQFRIKKNKIADYFLLLAFDNRESLNPMHIWLIKGTELVGINGKKVQLNDKIMFRLPNSVKSINNYRRFEKTDKLEKTIICCNKLKMENTL